ncbi:MAG: RsmE family RNA methyltransferase [Bacteroidota bacterium]
MDFFLADPGQIGAESVVLKGDEYKHLSRVLRKRVGDHVFVTDGRGTMYEVIIGAFTRTEAECKIVDTLPGWNEPKVDVTLAVSLLRNPARFDMVIEKGTELGMSTVIPLLCERTIPKQQKHERLQKIAVSALKQSGRCVLPQIFVLTRLDTLVRNSGRYDLKVLAHEKTEQSQFLGSLMKHHTAAKSVLVVVGPEGGLTAEEFSLAEEQGFVPVSLGPRRLRSETAAISALSWVVGGM